MPETTPVRPAVRTEVARGVGSIVLCRADEYNTITPQLRDELGSAVDVLDADPEARVILVRAEGPAFCAGYGLDWSTAAQAAQAAQGVQSAQAAQEAAQEAAPQRGTGAFVGRESTAGNELPRWSAGAARPRVWDSVADYRGMSTFVNTYMKLWYSAKPTIAAVQGWCIGGGTDMVLCADMIVAGEGAKFGYPPSRVWGTPTTAMWVYRMGLERAKRYLLTGDEIPAPEAARIGLILECVPDADLQEHAMSLAVRMAQVPANQLVMLKLLCNQTAENMGFASSRMLGTLFDGIARHTQEGLDFVERASEVGFRHAVRDRDDPFGDYGSRPRP